MSKPILILLAALLAAAAYVFYTKDASAPSADDAVVETPAAEAADATEAATGDEAEAAAEPLAADTVPEENSQAHLIEAFAYFSTFQSGYQAFGFGVDDAAAITKGVTQALADAEPSEAMIALIQSPEFQAFMQPRTEAAQAEAAAAQAEAQATAEAAAAEAGKENRAAGQAFIAALQEDAGVQSTESGLHYKILEPGEGDLPALTDTVLVHYKGTRIDGTPFDSSYDRGEPATFPLNGVVPGFGEGLTKIAAGGKIILYIPSELGYGNTPRPGGPIQPGDTLVFECELLEINPGS